jgi:hypothetical protein
MIIYRLPAHPEKTGCLVSLQRFSIVQDIKECRKKLQGEYMCCKLQKATSAIYVQ